MYLVDQMSPHPNTIGFVMEYRRLGHSGLRVPALSFGTATFGGATRLIDVCLDHGISMFDTADVYSNGLAEEILGQAIKGTPATSPTRCITLF